MHNVLNTQALQIVVLKKDLGDFLKRIFDLRKKKKAAQDCISPLDNFHMKDWTKFPSKVFQE